MRDQHSEALSLTASYVFDDAEDACEKFAGRRPGNVYVRFTNPTVEAFEKRMSALEGAEAAVAVSSGMAGYMALGFALLKCGDHVILNQGVFGTTTHLFRHYLAHFGVDTTVVATSEAARISEALRENTRMVVVETPTNPMMRVTDIRAARDAAPHAVLVVDNTLCTPIFQRPLEHGAHLVIHSASKYIDGQGRCGGGVIVGTQELIDRVRGVLRTTGPSLSPFNAWVFLKSLETLPVRMASHDQNGRSVAAWLLQHSMVESVYFTGLKQHPQAAAIAAQQTGHGGLVSFTIRGSRKDAWNVIDRLRLVSNTTNIGDTKSMITHPASTTHGRLSPEERQAAGIGENLLRLSVGLETADDILADLEQAMPTIRQTYAPHAALSRDPEQV